MAMQRTLIGRLSKKPAARLAVCALALCGLALTTSCDTSPTSGFGFSLPEGDAGMGERHFTRLHCNDCHSVVGREEFRALDRPYLMEVPLGGETARIATYGELVTSIINPSHRISSRYEAEDVSLDGESPMPNYNDVMTVTQLIDLVMFLQGQYEIKVEYPTDYGVYPYR